LAFSANKKIIFGLFLALAAVGGGIWFVYPVKNFIFNRAIKNPQPKTIVATPSKTADENPDSDRDGLKDWEEKLWGTDPNKPDTDGDGAPDGQEIKLGHNPLAAGPNDSLTENPPIQKQLSGVPETAEKKLTLSAEIARDYFANFISLKNQGLDENQIQDELYNSLAAKLEKEQKSNDIGLLRPFSASDAKLSGNSKEDIKNYANALGAIIKSEFKKNSLNEMLLLKDILTEASESGDYGRLSVFKDYQKSYLDSAAKMRALAVPPDYAVYHADLINSFGNFAAINNVFGNFSSDPFKGILAINNYQEEVKRSSAAFSGLIIKFLAGGVEFKSGEDGYIFVEIDKELNQTSAL
jgi:hypothetical protein